MVCMRAVSGHAEHRWNEPPLFAPLPIAPCLLDGPQALLVCGGNEAVVGAVAVEVDSEGPVGDHVHIARATGPSRVDPDAHVAGAVVLAADCDELLNRLDEPLVF